MPSEGPTFGFSIYQRIPEKKHTIQHYYCRYNQYFCWSAGFDCVGTNFGYLAGAWMWPLEFHPKLWTCIKMITAGGDKEIKNNHWLWISWSWWITTCFGNSDVYLILLVGGPREGTSLFWSVSSQWKRITPSCRAYQLLMGFHFWWAMSTFEGCSTCIPLAWLLTRQVQVDDDDDDYDDDDCDD